MLGPSGCGKTTLLRSIAGLETLDAGQILLGSRRIDDLAPHARPVNTVFQSYALFPHLTVSENIAFGLQMERKSKSEIAARVQEMLDLVQLSEMANRKPTSSRVASSSVWHSRGRSQSSPRCCCLMSRSLPSTSSFAVECRAN